MKVAFVKLLKVKFGPAIERLARSGSAPRMWFAVERASLVLFRPVWEFPAPEADEVKTMTIQKIEVSGEIKCRWGIVSANVLQAGPSVRSSEVNHLPAAVRKIARIARTDTQGTGGKCRKQSAAKEDWTEKQEARSVIAFHRGPRQLTYRAHSGPNSVVFLSRLTAFAQSGTVNAL